MEVSQAVVAPAHRSRGVMKELMGLLMTEARQRGLTGLFVVAVTVHPFSQRATLRYGFRESAILLGYVPRTIHMKKIVDQELPQRETVVYGYQPLHEDPGGRVFAPPHHRSIMARIYDNLGLERQLVSPGASSLSIEPCSAIPKQPRLALSTKVVSALGITAIEIANYGPGIEQEVKSKLGDLCHKEIAVVYLDLPLGDPLTATVCQRFEELGFFFSGIRPRTAKPTELKGGNSDDLLCLQYLNGPRIDYDLLQIHSDFGKELVQYVRERDPLA